MHAAPKSAEQYRDALRSLLPPGRLWPESLTSTLSLFFEGVAQEFVRLEDRAHTLVDEADPRTTTEMLADWEAMAGLPDPCHGLGATVQLRRAELVARLTARGSCSRQFYIDLAATLGFQITIDEFSPSSPGPGGLGYSGNDWWFVWRVNSPATGTTSSFRVGQSRVGERLRDWGSDVLECVIDRLKPAHTRVMFSYYDVTTVPAPMMTAVIPGRLGTLRTVRKPN